VLLLLLATGRALATESADNPSAGGEQRPPLRPPPALTLPELLGRWAGLTPSPASPDREPDRLHFVIFPFVVTNPLIGVGGGMASVGGVRLGPAGTTGWSSFATSLIATTNGQRSVGLLSDVRLPGGDWLLAGDWGWSRFPNPAWGLGGDTPDANRTVVDRRELLLHETIFRRLAGPLHLGAGYFLDSYYDIVDRRAAAGEATAFSAYEVGTRGRSFSGGASLALLLDTRDAPVNPSRGLQLLARARLSPSELGGDTRWQSVYLDARWYLPVPGRPDTLAFWAFGWSAYGRTPYLLLPDIGGDAGHRSGRGWIEGRHVGRDLIYGEVEYRFRIWELLGGVVGANLHSASDRTELRDLPQFRTFWPAASAGVRLCLDRQTQSNLVLDVAVNRAGGIGVYLNANEAF